MNITQLRADTPACHQLLHFNNAGASLMPQPVYAALTDHLALERDVGGYEAAERAVPTLASFYTEFASLLNAQPDEIAYVENATRAWDMAFYALPLTEGDRIITHGSEYASNYLAFLHQAKRRGLHIDVVPSDAQGQIDLDALRRAITPRSRVIAITHVPTQGGLVNPVAQVGRIANEHGLWYLLDACQSVGQLQVDVQAIGCHILSGTGRKFLRGPRGTGFLYVRKDKVEQLDPPFIDLQAATWTGPNTYSMAPGAMRFENWESYIAGRIGLARAVQYANALGMSNIEARIMQLGSALRSQLSQDSNIRIHDQGAQQCGIVTFTSQRQSPEVIAQLLKQHGINVSVSIAAYSQLDLGARNLPAVVRASVHYYNTQEEIDRFCATMHSLQIS